MYNFEKLKVWQEAMNLAKMVYNLSKELPKDERFSLVDQLKRAVTSVALNIAEGSGNNKKVFISFLNIAKRSLYETVTILKLIENLFSIDCKNELEKCDLVGKLLSGLIKSIESNNP